MRDLLHSRQQSCGVGECEQDFILLLWKWKLKEVEQSPGHRLERG